jgi:hypothetical protein
MKTSFELLISKLEKDHKNLLNWFFENKNKEILGWPKPFNSNLLASKAKGIYKPKVFKYALSIRISLNSPYDDNFIEIKDGKFKLKYFQENLDIRYRDIEYTNISLKECINDVVPIGVFMQIKKRPDPIYKVLGPAIVKSWNKGFFEVIGFSNSGEI